MLEGLEHSRERDAGFARLRGRLESAEGLATFDGRHPEASRELRCRAAEAAAVEAASLGLHAIAAQEWKEVVEVGPGGSTTLSSELEWAHSSRRAGHMEEAISAYTRVVEGSLLTRSERLEARYWRGRSRLETGSSGAGREDLHTVAVSASDPALSIDAYDHLARDCVTRGDLGGAAGWIESSRVRWAETSASRTPQGDRVRRALMRMSAIVELRLAIFDREVIDSDRR